MADLESLDPEQDSEPSPEAGRTDARLVRLEADVRDATELLSYALGAGYLLEREVVAAIRGAECALAAPSELLCSPARVKFDLAFRDLSDALRPVTAETLRVTAKDTTVRASPVHRTSRTVWIMTAGALFVILAGEIVTRLAGHEFVSFGNLTEGDPPGRSGWLAVVALVFSLIVPFAYGGLGACAQLLRKLHRTIYERTFDVNRRQEYLNRVLLGLVSGGLARLLFEASTDFEGKAIPAAALAFVAGYQNDFLFTAVDRISAALFPKVELSEEREPPRRAPPRPKANGESGSDDPAGTGPEPTSPSGGTPVKSRSGERAEP
ncbi:MAG TPA: hypothetical protein VF989_04070 [Polyangiaceae bacterium]